MTDRRTDRQTELRQQYCTLHYMPHSKKWKYKLQQLFESLDTGLELFSPLVSGPVNNGLFEVSPDLKGGVERISTFLNKAHQGIQLCLGDSEKI